MIIFDAFDFVLNESVINKIFDQTVMLQFLMQTNKSIRYGNIYALIYQEIFIEYAFK